MTATPPRKLKVFLCHSSHDKPAVQEIYARLKAEGWIDPWLDEEKLLPGQDWDLEIEKAVEETDAVLVFLSDNSVSKEGYIQRELRLILNMADYKPEGTNFVLPMRLNECPLPRRLRTWHYVDYFPEERKEWAYGRLLGSLKLRVKKLGIDVVAILKENAEKKKEELAEKARREQAERERREKAAREAAAKAERERIVKEKREVEEKARLEKEAEEERERKAAAEKAHQEKIAREKIEIEEKVRQAILRKKRRQERQAGFKKFFSKNGKRFSLISGAIALFFLFSFIASNMETPVFPDPTQTLTVTIKQPEVSTPIRTHITATLALSTSTPIPTVTKKSSSATMSNIRESGVVVVAIANEFPYGYLDENNKLRGISPDIARAVLEIVFDKEIDIKPIVTEWGDLIPSLKAGHIDMIAAAMYITPERCETVAFGNPDYTIKDSLLVTEGNPYRLHSYADIAANPEVKAATGKGYAEYDKMLNEGIDEGQITLFADAVSGAAGIRAGEIDAYTGIASILYGVMDDLGNGSGIEIVDDFIDPEANFGSIVFRQEDTEFVEAYNAALEELKANGTLLEIHNMYSGFGDFTLPGNIVAEDICD